MNLMYTVDGSKDERKVSIELDPPLLVYEEVKPRLLAIPSSAALSPAGPAAAHGPNSTGIADAASLQQLFILYGSNTGSSETFAQRLASEAPAHGE